MNSALLSGVSGLSSHQRMLDVAGNNLANVNTNAFKSSRVTFSELLSQTMRNASQPSETTGGTNPMQIGSGVQVASVDRNMSQGSLINTGQPLDMAMEGSGYFVLSDGAQDVYSRVGAFAVDSLFYLIDPATGNRVQRVGSEGVAEGFQSASSNDIRIPYDMALPAKDTETVTYIGNISADEQDVTTNLLTSGIQYSVSGAGATSTTDLDALDQGATLVDGDIISISGVERDGTPVAATDFACFAAGASKTMGDLLTAIETLFPDSTATLNNGEIRLVDKVTGYSQTDLNLAMKAGSTGALTLPKYFAVLTPGGNASRNTNVEIFDSLGIGHTASASFVRTDTANQWDMVLTSVTGDVELNDRRVNGVTFLADGSYGGITGADVARFQMTFGHDPTNVRTISLELGTTGEFNGLTQFGGNSTVAPSGQDGYASGWLSSMAVMREGTLVGIFTNGVRRDIASLKLATFQNAGGLESIGSNYFMASANSGEPVATKALSGGAGAVRGGSLEKSNVEVAAEFVNMIQAQNGFQANARTIRVANEMLKELTNLIR